MEYESAARLARTRTSAGVAVGRIEQSPATGPRRPRPRFGRWPKKSTGESRLTDAVPAHQLEPPHLPTRIRKTLRMVNDSALATELHLPLQVDELQIAPARILVAFQHAL